MASSVSRFGSSSPAGAWQTTRPGPTKRAMLSIWPSVWSFFRPSSIQMIFLAPKASPSAASACALRPAVAVGVEQRLARGQHRALAVVVDGAAFQHEVEALHGRIGDARDVVADRRVVRQIVLAAPAVGGKAQRDAPDVRARENRPRVAQPDVAVARRHEVGGAAQSRARRGFRFRAVDQQAHGVGFAQGAHHRRHVAARRLEVAVPLLGVRRPSRPNGLEQRPLGRDVDRRLGNVWRHLRLSVGVAQRINSGRRPRWGASYRALVTRWPVACRPTGAEFGHSGGIQRR